MRTILNNFIGTFERVKNNFYFSFLALEFLNQRPFENNIEPPNNLPADNFTAEFLNSFSSDSIQEHGNSIRRHFLNDMVVAYETYSTTMYFSHIHNSRMRIEPATINDKSSKTHLFEDLHNVYDPDDKKFLGQLRRLRNSIVHYNGVYCESNPLDYTFGTETCNSSGKIGQDIEISFENLVWIHNKLRDTVIRENTNYFTHNSIP